MVPVSPRRRLCCIDNCPLLCSYKYDVRVGDIIERTPGTIDCPGALNMALLVHRNEMARDMRSSISEDVRVEPLPQSCAFSSGWKS